MFRHVLVAISLIGAAGAASANPVLLSDQQLDSVTGGVIVAVDFARIAENGVRGFVVTLTELDTRTGELTTRTFGRSITIPTIPTFGPGVVIGGTR
jgi:hypothetical protein